MTELNLDTGGTEICIAQKSLFFNKHKFCARNNHKETTMKNQICLLQSLGLKNVMKMEVIF